MEHTINHYKDPVFPGYSIGCERCHGPGELHVAERERGPASVQPDDTIVNPNHLSPELRESVCQQCHLQGAARIIRHGRQPFDFRPGLPLHLFRSVFVRPEGLVDDKAVSQVEQMYSSKCFQASKGELGCITCHNPHEWPEPDQRIGYYRDRCLKCHDHQSRCSLPLAQRQARQDNCIACHMPPANTPDIAHTALSDHRIRRRPDEVVAAPRRPPWEALERPLIHFHQDLISPQDKGISRDLGVALIEEARRAKIEGTQMAMDVQMAMTQLALPLLDEAAAADPGDLAAWEARGHALWLRGHVERALAVFEQVLEKAPNRETALQAAQTISEINGNPKDALDYGKRLIAVNPWNSQYHYYQARLLAARLEWGPAARACQASLKINPANSEVRKLLIHCYVRTNDKAEALREFDVLLALSPAKEHELRAWLASEKP